MEYIIRGLGFLIIPIMVNGVLAFLKQSKETETEEVHLPNFFLILGLICSVIFLIPTIITAFLAEPIWIPIIFFTLSLIGSCFIIAFANCRVYYDEDGFVAKNFFGIKRKFTYDQVTAIKENMHEDYIYIGKSKVMIDEISVGGIYFIEYVREKYSTIHNDQELPIIQSYKRDIFNGNVGDVFSIVLSYIIIGVLIVAFAIFLIWYIYTPCTVDNTIKQEVSFTSYDIKDNVIILISSENKVYKISFPSEGFDPTEIKSICDDKILITTYSQEFSPDNEDAYYLIRAIIYDNTYLLSFDETNRWHQEEYRSLLLWPIGFAMVWGIYIVGSIIVGRNPKRFSRRVVKLFFKEGYVKY